MFGKIKILLLLFEQYSNFVLSDVNAVHWWPHISAINVVWCWLILFYMNIFCTTYISTEHFTTDQTFFIFLQILQFSNLQEMKVAINFISFTYNLFSFILFPNKEEVATSVDYFCPKCLYVIMTPTLSWSWYSLILGCCGVLSDIL